MADNDYSDIKDPVVRRMMRNFELSQEAFADDRKRALYSMNFRKGGKDQWDSAMWDMRGENNRPRESYNQIPQFLHRITNAARQNMPQTRFVPGNDASQEVAEVREDLARNIQTSSEGEVAYDNAVDSQVTIGWGYWRYVTEYEGDKTFDQVIKIKWVPNSLMVYDDPNSMEQDFSDRSFLIQVFDLPKEDFNADRKKSDQYDSADLSSIGDQSPGWATDSTVRVAEYWEVIHKRKTLYRVNGKITENKPAGDIDEEDQREVLEPKVMWYKCTAREVLEKKEWLGKYIPYVRISGEMQIIDGRTFYSGLVEPMIAPQKMYNYWVNTATEIMGLAPLSPWLAAAGQTEDFPEWQTANIKKHTVLRYNTMDVHGNNMPAPQRNSTNSDISGAMAMVQQAQENFYVVTGIYPANLGQQSNETSGKAINARKVEGDTANYHFIDNLARGQRFGGRILDDLFPIIYDGSRTIRGLKEDGTTREVKINQRYFDEDSQEHKEFDMTSGSYDVVVTTGPSYATKRQDAAEGQILMLQTPLGAIIAQTSPDIIIRNQDWPGATEIADRVKRALPPAITADEKKGQLPPQVQAQMQQMQTIIEQMQMQLQQNEQDLADKQADVANKQADLEIKKQQMEYNAQDAQLNAQLEMEKIQLEREKMELERVKIEFDAFKANQVPQATMPYVDTTDEEALLNHVDKLRQYKVEKQEQEAIEEQERQRIEAERAYQEQVEQQRVMDEQAQQQALYMTLGGIQQCIEGLTNSINAPRKIVRDENNIPQGIMVGETYHPVVRNADGIVEGIQ